MNVLSFTASDPDLSSEDDYYSGYSLSHLDESFDNEDREELRVSAADVENFGTAYAKYKARILKDSDTSSC